MKSIKGNRKKLYNIDNSAFYLFRNIVKILKEHKYLVESTKSIIQLNKRLQTFGLCSHAINEKNRKEIKDLQMKLIAFSINELKSVSTIDKLHPEIETLCFKVDNYITIT